MNLDDGIYFPVAFAFVETRCFASCYTGVSPIQPKPNTGLEDVKQLKLWESGKCFNPAEAEYGFRSNSAQPTININGIVSIQPKPNTGLEVF